MKRIILFVTIIIALLSLVACGGNNTTGPKGPKKVFQPDWYSVQDNADYLYAYGKAEKVSENASSDAAVANAYLEAAQYVKSHVKGMLKNYLEEAGNENPEVTSLTSKVVKVVSNAKFQNTSVTKRETYKMANNRYKTFVRVSIPKAEINKNLLNQVKHEEALYNQFKASQSFKELENEVEKNSGN